MPIYETQRKIPTGRMDLKERQRLREQMDMLDIRRAENISKKRSATKQRVLAHIRQLQEEDKLRKDAVNLKIAEEQKSRWEFRQAQEKKEREEESKLENMRKVRKKAVEVKEERTEEQDEWEYKALRQRLKEKDAAKANELLEKQLAWEDDRRKKDEEARKKDEERQRVQVKREMAWKARDDKVTKKEKDQLKEILEVKKERERIQKLQRERNSEFLQNLHVQRQPIFKEQLEHTEERQAARDSEEQALNNYKEARAIPKKVKTKGKFAPKGNSKAEAPKAKAKVKTKKKGGDDEAEPDDPKVDTERVLDAVEAKMRRQMAEASRCEELQEKRDEKIAGKDQQWKDRENTHNADVREQHRQANRERAETAAERRIIMKQRDDGVKAAEADKIAQRARLQKVREQNIARKEQKQLEALCAC